MNYGLAVLKSLGLPIEKLHDMLEVLEPPCIDHRLETFRTISFPNEGIEFAVTQYETLLSAHLFSEGLDEKKEYHRGLPFSITFRDQQIDVAKKMDRPPEASGGGNHWAGKVVPKWDKYCIDGALIHFQYSRVDGGVELITMMIQGQMP